MADVTQAIRNISELTPAAQKACKLFMQRCTAAGYDIFITETYRPQARQDYIYSQGRTRPGNIVTWTKNSRHTSRRAWDIATRGGDLYNAAVLRSCGAIAAQLGITWGGTWKTPDTPHFEISANWTAPEGAETEDEPMTEAEKAKMQAIDESLTNLYESVNKLIDRVDKLTKTYNTVDEAPQYARATLKKLADKGLLKGDGGGLDVTDDMARMLVILERAGVI